MTQSEPQVVRDTPTELPNVVAGFDGFVDTILQAVSARNAPDEFTPVATAEEFGRMVSAAGIGRNANIELVVRRRKLGGNGPFSPTPSLNLEFPLPILDVWVNRRYIRSSRISRDGRG
jgi:hypothetical protein